MANANPYNKDFNQVIIDCRLTTEPEFEIKQTKANNALEFVRFGCVNNTSKGLPCFFNAYAWGKEAQKAYDMLHKGYGILIRGKLMSTQARFAKDNPNFSNQSSVEIHKLYLNTIPDSDTDDTEEGGDTDE